VPHQRAFWGQGSAVTAYDEHAMERRAQCIDRTCSLCGFLTVSSTLRIKHAASVALLIALSLTRLGSQTKASMLSCTPSVPSTSTPTQLSSRA
jgi:hypothetical protein